MALSFNGTSSKLTLPNPAITGFPFSIFCWVKPTSGTASQMVAGFGDMGGLHESLIFAAGADPGSKMKAFTKDAAGSTFAASTQVVTANTWLPVLVTYTNNTRRDIYYGSGAVVNTTDSISTDPTLFDRFVVGCRGITDTLWFNGDIAHVAAWTSVLTQTDYDALAAGAVPDTIKNSTLFDYWSFPANTGTQTGSKGKVLTAFNTALAASDPLTGTTASVSATGIASSEAFGTSTITANGLATVSAAGNISSSEAFGTSVFTSSLPAVVSPTGIASAEVFGNSTTTSNAPASPVQVVGDGIWTWYTDPRAVYRNGATYLMAVDSAGTCKIHKYVHSTGVSTSFTLSGVGLEKDDHNNGSILFLPSGRIVAFYGLHNDSIIRYRVSNAAESIDGGWSAEQQRGTGDGPFSYPTPYILSQDPSKQYIFTRRWFDSGGNTRTLAFRTAPDFGTVPASLSNYTDVIYQSGARPYVKSISDGVKRIHICATSAHPNEATFVSVNHFYMELDGSNVMKYYKTDGTEITTLPMPISSMTRVDDGTDVKRWNSDITIDSNGYPRILWMKYPNNNGTDIRYMYSRWNGSAWVTQELIAAGAGLYAGEQYYHRGLCFDSKDANKIYMSVPVAGVDQIQEWRSSDGGATMQWYKDITSGGTSTSRKLRPFSPKDHNGVIPVVWFEGRYDTFSDYNTAVYALKSVQETVVDVSSVGGIVSSQAFGTSTTTAVFPAANVTPSGISSSEAFGTAAVSSGSVFSITDAGGISSAQAFGALSFVVSSVRSLVNTGGLISSETFGNSIVTIQGSGPGDGTLTPETIQAIALAVVQQLITGNQVPGSLGAMLQQSANRIIATT